jgi:hypothetical protein
MPAATKVSTSKTSITIEWTEPQDNGCPVTGFEIFRDTGNNDALTVSVDLEIVQHKPSLRQYQITNGLTNLGSTYRFKIRAFNHAGYSDSESFLSVVLSDEPDQPTTGPVSDALITNESRVKVDYGPQSIDKNGGSPLLSYELQMDDGIGGNFTSMIGYETDSLETTFTVKSEQIQSGSIFRFRYRTRNTNGWSLFSPISHIKAATIAVRPPAPTLILATAASISVNLFETTLDGGEIITGYELHINEGGASTVYRKVITYDGFDTTHTISTGGNPELGLVAGTIYKFKYRANNAYGYSDWSEELNVGLGDNPG